MNDLLPCPFCGSEAYIFDDTAPKFLRVVLCLPERYEIHCASKLCPAKLLVGGFDTVGEAVKAWNTRLAKAAR